ncbi:carbohydrate porin [Sphingomonas sp. M6A6_1c]
MWQTARTAIGRAAATTALAIGGSAQAQDAVAPAWTLAATYKADVAGVASGGLDTGLRMLDDLYIAGKVDLDAAFGWKRAQAHASLLNNLGGQPNRLAGSIQGIDNIEVADRRLKLYEAWLEQGIGSDTTLRTGLYDINSEFYQNEAAGLLVSPMFGVGSELAATGVNGPAIFPSTALAARFRVTTARSYGAFAVVNAHAGTIGDDDGIDLSGRDGALLIGEAGWTGSGRFAIGAWRYTRKQPAILSPGLTVGLGTHVSRGVYLLGEHDLLGTVEGPRHLIGFLRLGLSEGRTTPFRGGWQGGLLLQRPFAARPASALSVGAGSGMLSRSYRRSQPAGLGQIETIYEATYSDEPVHGVSLQPDIQYVVHPSADPTIRNALVLALRVTIGWTSN